MRAALRFVASVMMVSGTLLIADAGTTLLWQEPVSWYVADRQQARLEQAVADPTTPGFKRTLRRKPLKGDAIGKITIPAINVRYYIVEGTDLISLRKGPGHYPSTPMPGDRGTTAIAGHRTTYGAPFRKLNRLKRGERITLDMPYGRFVYHVERLKIVDDQDLSVLRRVRHNRLILSACHPLYSAAERIIVFARQVRKEPAHVKKRRT